jgi:hypothetical protein
MSTTMMKMQELNRPGLAMMPPLQGHANFENKGKILLTHDRLQLLVDWVRVE